jgi:hypothetical protein
MASGSRSAHSKWRRPGKSNKVTALAPSTPTRATPIATLTHSANEVSVYSGSTVCAICTSTSRAAASNPNQAPASANTGSTSTAASNNNRT